jgi:hypothetical protein
MGLRATDKSMAVRRVDLAALAGNLRVMVGTFSGAGAIMLPFLK